MVAKKSCFPETLEAISYGSFSFERAGVVFSLSSIFVLQRYVILFFLLLFSFIFARFDATQIHERDRLRISHGWKAAPWQ